MRLVNKRNNITIAEKVYTADTLFSRLKGLLGTKSLHPDHVLIINNTKQIHSFFMQFPIDVLFLDKNRTVIKIYKNFKPYRISTFLLNAKYVVELAQGALEKKDVSKGDTIDWQ
ncbi:DUF192 domain-containing protein [bacterium]